MKREGMKPDIIVYNSLLACISEEGLPLEAWAVIDDMKAMGVPPDRQSYHLLMQACRWASADAIWEIVDEMKRQDIQPNEHTYALIIKRATTTESIELALRYMHEMRSRGLTPELTTAQDIIKLAADMGLPRLALDIAQTFEAQSLRRIDSETWMSCLMSSADMLYADGVQTCWQNVVRGLGISPGEGLCLSVLHTCARHGLADLAKDVMLVLQKTGLDLWEEYHFAPLIEAFCKAGMLKEAFGTFETMRVQCVVPTIQTARPILEFLTEDVDRVDGAWEVLTRLRKEGKKIDIVVMNAIIQASVALGDLPRAVGAYKSFSDYDCKPNVDTFNLLFAGCVAAKHRELGNKLLLDLTKADAQPNATTFEQIILLCLTQPTYEDAFFYIEEMKAEKFIPSAKIYEAVIRTCVAAGDSRYSLALAEMGRCGYEASPSLRQVIAEYNSALLQKRHPSSRDNLAA
ncbi:hypothetical protein BU15DRAFT_44674 [Melanogaster broomeanus]|nr:hypothetical protein BU15DRAFT_44674 [Melanogaster broomeanus]